MQLHLPVPSAGQLRCGDGRCRFQIRLFAGGAPAYFCVRAPAYASLYADPAVVAKRPFFPTLLTSLNNAQPRPKVVQYGATTKAIQEEAYAAITGKKDTDTALNDMQAKLTELSAK